MNSQLFRLLYARLAVEWSTILPFLLLIIFLNTPWIGADAPLVLMSIFAMTITFCILPNDEQQFGGTVVNGQPASARAVVTTKYVFHMLVGLCIIAIAALTRVVFADVPTWAVVSQMLPPVIAITIFISVFFPLYYRFGTQPVRIAMAVLLFTMLIALPLLDGLAAKHHLWGMLDLVPSLPSLSLRWALTGGTIVALLVSWSMSVRWYTPTAR